MTIEGIKIYGSPHQPVFHDWAFNRGDDKRRRLWSLIPSDTDILLTHGPPYEIMDLCSSGARAGCRILRDEVLARIKPKYHVFGHIHGSNGVKKIDGVTFINAATCESRYRPVNPIYVFDLPVKN